MLRKYPHPGKYEGETMLTPYLHELSMAGCDDETGDVSEGGWYGLLRGPFRSEGPFADVTPTADLTADERAYLSQLAGVILCEDENGFVSAILFDEYEADKMAEEWDMICTEGR